LVAFRCRIDRRTQPESITGGIDMPSFLRADVVTKQRQILPLDPVWPALAVDAALFGTPLLVAISLPSLVRSTRRQRRVRLHLCTECGYSLKGLPDCPECGGMNPNGHRRAQR
jgi:hypothetical protein